MHITNYNQICILILRSEFNTWLQLMNSGIQSNVVSVIQNQTHLVIQFSQKKMSHVYSVLT